MTRTQPVYAAGLSANDAFKLQYPKYLKRAVLGALALTALFVWLWPGYQATPYEMRRRAEITWVDIEPPAEVPELPEVVEVPRIPPVIDVVEEGEVDLPYDWSSDPWDVPIDPTPVLPPSDTGFVASSSLPELVQHAKADYPLIARRSGLEGTVIISALVDPRGNVEKAVVIQSAHPILDRAAMNAAMKCRFTPAKQRTIAVRAWVAIPYRFRLN